MDEGSDNRRLLKPESRWSRRAPAHVTNRPEQIDAFTEMEERRRYRTPCSPTCSPAAGRRSPAPDAAAGSAEPSRILVNALRRSMLCLSCGLWWSSESATNEPSGERNRTALRTWEAAVRRTTRPASFPFDAVLALSLTISPAEPAMARPRRARGYLRPNPNPVFVTALASYSSSHTSGEYLDGGRRHTDSTDLLAWPSFLFLRGDPISAFQAHAIAPRTPAASRETVRSHALRTPRGLGANTSRLQKENNPVNHAPLHARPRDPREPTCGDTDDLASAPRGCLEAKKISRTNQHWILAVAVIFWKDPCADDFSRQEQNRGAPIKTGKRELLCDYREEEVAIQERAER
nr:unnamed protein product [Digitaria exilis]